MNISKKKLILIIIGSYLGLNLIFSSLWLFVGQKLDITGEPNYDKILTEQEIKKVLDNTVVDFGSTVAQHEHTDNGEFNKYSASFSAGSLDIKLNFDDMTKWDTETMKTLTNDPDVIWEDYVMKAYYKMVKMFAESVHYNFVYYEDTSYLTKIMGYDVEVSSFEPYKENLLYTERAKTVIGNYMLYVVVSHEDETQVADTSESRLEIFMNNFLKAL